MPLLRKKPFKGTPEPENLRDDENIFYCEITNEIFRDYEEFCERIILVNSMVWSCSMTGKTNLTFAEALQSERSVRKSLRDFPVELQKPMLFLASKTKRSAFGEMAEDVFQFLKDRYFVSEIVETCFTENNWREGHVLQVIAPSEEQIEAYTKAKQNGNKALESRKFHPPAMLYRYEVEQLDADDQDSSQVMIVEASQVRRRRGPFTKEKHRFFLKQYAELSSDGIWVVKEDTFQRFHLDRVNFDQMFDGPIPDFDSSKKRSVTLNGKKTHRQETLVKYLKKTNYFDDGKQLAEEMRKREADYKQRCQEMKQRKAEEKVIEKQRRKEENMKMLSYVKEWNRPKEDLELEDQRALPGLEEVRSKIPDKYLGDALMIMEFSASFSGLLHVKNYFPAGLTLDLMERALTETEVAGPLTDIVQMFLTTLFNIQADEAAEKKASQTSVNPDEQVVGSMSLSEATHLATVASKWSLQHQGMPLNRLPLYPLTVTEVLRLHLLSSGARVSEAAAKWRFQQRGGYTSEDDPGLALRLTCPHILKALAVHNLNQLSVGSKMKILKCLMDQLLTYADVRDLIEEKIEKSRQTKLDLRALQAAERRREQEFISNKLRMKRELKLEPTLPAQLEANEREAETKRADYEEKCRELTNASIDYQICLGQDRAYRRYLKMESVPGLLVEHREDFPGRCVDHLVQHKPELVDADRADMLSYVRKLYEECNGSDKENEHGIANGQHMNGVLPSVKPDTEDIVAMSRDLLMCTAGHTPCPVHSPDSSNRWSFVANKEQLDQLIESLNRRGVRESELRQTLETDPEMFEEFVGETNVTALNPEVVVTETSNGDKEKKVPKKVQDMYTRYEDANLGFPASLSVCTVLRLSVVDNLLEMEEKIYTGNLGQLRVCNRELWRTHLSTENYPELEKLMAGGLLNRSNKEDHLVHKLAKTLEDAENGGSRPDTPDTMHRDPGRCIPLHQASCDSDASDTEEISLSEDQQTSVRILGLALTQIARAVESRHLKKPLGSSDLKKKNTEKKYDMLEKWELSLASATSYAQVLLHYCTLDNCVMWSRSSLLARCRICHRQKDAQSMLLCDGCNKGQHMYCLKPKLTQVPKGNWYCEKCKPVELKDVKQVTRRRRRIFTDHSDEEMEQDTQQGQEEESKEGQCDTCGTYGCAVHCSECSRSYHLECARPPLRRTPRGSWKCQGCKDAALNGGGSSHHCSRASSAADSDESWSESGSSGTDQGQAQEQGRKCAARARDKIHGFVQSLRRNSVDSGSGSGNSEDNTPTIQRRSIRRTQDKTVLDDDLPLHNAVLQQLLSETMRHEHAWPFTRPVLKAEVPDYYEVISRPMDFGKVKYKLNMGEYRNDQEVLQDCALVFDNCNTYNNSEAQVYQCGLKLLKYFENKCDELHLKFPRGLMDGDEAANNGDDGPTRPKRSRNQR